MLKLRGLIKKVRACKTAEEERLVINKESAEMRSMKELNDQVKCRNIAKCIFIHMLGYPTSFIQMTCVNLLSSSNFTYKRIAYVALCVLMDEKSEVLLLTTSTIKKDLESSNQYIVAIALNAIGEVCTPYMCRELASEITKLIKNPNPYIKKKAALACSKVIRKCPEFVDSIADKLDTFFEDKNHGVLLCGLSLAVQVFKLDDSYVEKYSKYLKNMIRYLRNLVSTNYAPEYDINGITDPFLQVKILEVLTYFGKDNEDASDEMNDLLANISTNTDSSKNTGNAVLYELVRTIINIQSNTGLKTLGSNILGRFLSHRDNNYKYIALNTLQEVAKTDLNSVQKHKSTILDCLKDNDVSIKRRSLDLIYVIINSNNIKQIVKECLNFLLVAENEFKLELTSKISQSLDKYSPSIKWQVDTLIKMLCLSANYVTEETISNTINLIVTTSELHLYAVHKLFITISNNQAQEGLVKVGVYIFGEFGDLLVNNSMTGPNDENISVKEDQVLVLLNDIYERKYSNSSVKEYLLNCFMKLTNKLSNQNIIASLNALIDNETKSYYCEVQQRAVEYSCFTKNNDSMLKKSVTELVPNSKLNTVSKEDLSNRQLVEEDGLDEGDIKLDKNSINTVSKNNYETGKNSNLDIFGGSNELVSNTNTNSNNNNNNNVFNDIFGNNNNTPNETNKNSNTSGSNVFDDIFGGNNQNSTPTPNNNNNIIDMLGGSNKESNNNTNNVMDLMGGSNSTSNNNTGMDMFNTPNEDKKIISDELPEVFSNLDIKITVDLKKTDDCNLKAVYYISNNTSKSINNINVKFLAPKYIKVNVISTSGSVLESNQVKGINKEVDITNQDSSRDIVLKLKISYTNGDSQNIEETVTLKNF